MASRKSRRNRGEETSTSSLKKNAKTRLVIMIVSVFLMIFSATQVYYLAKYTFGFEISEQKLSVYRWVQKLVDGTDLSEQ